MWYILILTLCFHNSYAIILEAENGIIFSPMIIQYDNTASGNNYVSVPTLIQGFYGETLSSCSSSMIYNPVGSNFDNEQNGGYVEFNFNIDEKNLYEIRITTLADNSGSDSFWLSFNNEPFKRLEIIRSNTWFSQPITFTPSVSLRTEFDFEGYIMDVGNHNLKIKWREWGTKLDYVNITSNYGQIKINEITGCEGNLCNTEGGRIIIIKGEHFWRNMNVKIGNKECYNISNDIIFPNRQITCIVPEGYGANLPIHINMLNKNYTLENAVSYAPPTVKSVSGCSDYEISTHNCKKGDRITIFGSNFGNSNSELSVLIGNNECLEVDRTDDPHNKVICTLPEKENNERLEINVGNQKVVSNQIRYNVSYTNLILSVALPIIVFILIIIVTYLGYPRYKNYIQRRKIIKNSNYLENPWIIKFADIKLLPDKTKNGEDMCEYNNSKCTIHRIKSNVDLEKLEIIVKNTFNSESINILKILGICFDIGKDTALIIKNNDDLISLESEYENIINNESQIDIILNIIKSVSNVLYEFHSYENPIFLNNLNMQNIFINKEYSRIYVDSSQIWRSCLTNSKHSSEDDIFKFGMVMWKLINGNASIPFINSKNSKKKKKSILKSFADNNSLTNQNSSRSNLSSRSNASSKSSKSGVSSKNVSYFNLNNIAIPFWCPAELLNLTVKCLDRNSNVRPNIVDISNSLEQIDNNLKLEKLVNEQTKKIKENTEKIEKLLYNTIPSYFVEKLKKGEDIKHKIYENCSVVFIDIVGFTDYSSKVSPDKVINLIETLYGSFDNILSKYDMTGIGSIGDAYLACCGTPIENENHADNAIRFSMNVLNIANRTKLDNNDTIKIRIGINSGSLVGGLMKLNNYKFDIYGDTVNTAQRLESTAETNTIQISENTKDYIDKLKNSNMNYELIDLGEKEIKGKGKLKTYRVDPIF